MTDKELKITVLQTIKEAVDKYALAFDPCEMCEHQDKSKKENLETCLKCCYYYSSKFEPENDKLGQNNPKIKNEVTHG